MARSSTCEMFEMARTLLNDGEHGDAKKTLASSLARRGYGDILWLRSAVQQASQGINSLDDDGRPLLQVLLQVPWQGGKESGLEDGKICYAYQLPAYFSILSQG